jgi:glycosyltransferase involved in cell wall biosynthesis
MQIGFDAKRAFNNYTGLGNYSRTLLNSLITNDNTTEFHLFAPPFKVQARNQFLTQPPFKIHQPQTPIGKKLHGLWRTYGVAAAAQKQKIDVFHGLSHELPEGLAAKGIRSVVTMHDLIFERFPSFYPIADRLIYRAKFKRAAKISDLVVAISQQTATDLQTYYDVPAEKIKIIYQAADSIFDQPPTKEQIASAQQKYNLPSAFILYVGTVNERKNLAILLKSLQNLPKDYRLVIIGEGGDYFKKMRLLSLSLQVDDRVLWLGSPQFVDFPAIYAAATVFCLPSRFEGFGIPIIEALWSKVPVIAAAGSCLEEAGGPQSRYVDPDNIEGWTEQIKAVYENDTDRKAIIAQGLDYAKTTFDRNGLASIWLDTYQKLASQ